MATQNQNRIVDSGRLFVRITGFGQVLTVAVQGEIDLANAGLLDAELERAEQTDAEEIVLDLSDVEFIDSTGLRVLMAAGRRSELDSNRLGVRRGTGQVARLMKLTQIDQMVRLLD
jgi:anti-sigma B factor antagonist